MSRLLAFIVAIAFLVSSGLVHGIWTERWQKSEELQDACARVSDVPLVIGAWKGQAVEVAPDEFVQAGAEGYWMRTYTNQKQTVRVLLMCGRAGRMSVHTPEICYQGLGYQVMESPMQDVIALDTDERAQFWSARFVKESGPAQDLQIFWGWSSDGAWKAPSNPRWEFRGQPFLYKLYVVQDIARQPRPDEAQGSDFLRQFLPALNKVLFPK
jgi:hypothetical protein